MHRAAPPVGRVERERRRGRRLDRVRGAGQGGVAVGLAELGREPVHGVAHLGLCHRLVLDLARVADGAAEDERDGCEEDAEHGHRHRQLHQGEAGLPAQTPPQSSRDHGQVLVLRVTVAVTVPPFVTVTPDTVPVREELETFVTVTV